MTQDDQETVLRIRPEELPPEQGAAAPARSPGEARVAFLAWIAFGLGVASILIVGVAIGPVAMATGLVAAMQAQRTGEQKRHSLIAAAGILLGLSGTLLWTGLIVYWAGKRSVSGQPPASGAMPITAGRLDREAIEHAPRHIRRALASSASIIVERPSGTSWRSVASGSGTFVSYQDGRWYVLTCAHVVPEASETPGSSRLRVLWIGGEMGEPKVEWIGPPWLDLALISTGERADEDRPAITLIAATTDVGIGDRVFAVGDPHEYRASYVTGVLSAVRVVSEGASPLRILQSQVPLNPGNSGGGLYNERGELIAVNSWRLKDIAAEGIGFSIAIENLWTGLAGAPAHLVDILRRDQRVSGGGIGPGAEGPMKPKAP